MSSMPEVPQLETARLTLRGHTLADFDDSAAMWADPVVTRHIGGRPFTREEVWTRLLRYVGHWALLDFGFWVMHDKASGRFVGEAGFLEGKRELVPSLEGTPEIGWALASWAHGRGLATEAVRAVVEWGARNLPSRRTVCLVDVANQASVRVAAKCGYVEYARTTYKGAPVILFERG